MSRGGKETRISLDEFAKQLSGMGPIVRHSILLRVTVDGRGLTVFPAGRAIAVGTDDVAVARSLQAKYIGS